MNKINRFVLAVGLGLAIALSFGCSLIANIPWPSPMPSPAPTATPTPTPTPTPVPSPVPSPTPVPTPVPTPTPTPGGKKPSFPHGVPDDQFGARPDLPVLGDMLNREMSALTGCPVGSGCHHGKTPDGFEQAVVARLRQSRPASAADPQGFSGYAAGEHRLHESDEIAVRVTAHDSGQACEWEGYHVTTYTADPAVVWAGKPTRPCSGGGSEPDGCPQVGGGAFRGVATIPPIYCSGPDDWTDCPVKLRDLDGDRLNLALQVGAHGSTGQQYDGTPILSTIGLEHPFPDLRVLPGYTGNCIGPRQCLIGSEKDIIHGAACTVELCGAALAYTVEGGDCVLNWIHGYTAKVTGDHCVLRAHCPAFPAAKAAIILGAPVVP